MYSRNRIASAEKEIYPRACSARYRDPRYWYGCLNEITEVSGTGMKVCTGTGIKLLSYRTCRSVRCRYWCRTEIAEVSGTGIDAIPNLLKCLIPVLMSY